MFNIFIIWCQAIITKTYQYIFQIISVKRANILPQTTIETINETVAPTNQITTPLLVSESPIQNMAYCDFCGEVIPMTHICCEICRKRIFV
jgi:hypothetical protein